MKYILIGMARCDLTESTSIEKIISMNEDVSLDLQRSEKQHLIAVCFAMVIRDESFIHD
jgi:signal transduction histidine kinase